MLKRIIYIGTPRKIRIKDNNLLLHQVSDGLIDLVPVEDIGFLILDNQNITISQNVLQSLLENKCAIVTCNQKHMPLGLFLNLDGSQLQAEMFALQIATKLPVKKQLWKQIIIAKIENQAQLVSRLVSKDASLPLYRLSKQVQSGDITNREAIAARYYWHQLFGNYDFAREREGDPPNNALNYGYSILRAGVARAIMSSGLLPTFGIHHHNRYNSYCLADDVMEPYRPFVDEIVWMMVKNNEVNQELTIENKRQLLNILNYNGSQ